MEIWSPYLGLRTTSGTTGMSEAFKVVLKLYFLRTVDIKTFSTIIANLEKIQMSQGKSFICLLNILTSDQCSCEDLQRKVGKSMGVFWHNFPARISLG